MQFWRSKTVAKSKVDFNKTNFETRISLPFFQITWGNQKFWNFCNITREPVAIVKVKFEVFIKNIDSRTINTAINTKIKKTETETQASAENKRQFQLVKWESFLEISINTVKYSGERTSIMLNRVRFRNLQNLFKYPSSVKKESVKTKIFNSLKAN